MSVEFRSYDVARNFFSAVLYLGTALIVVGIIGTFMSVGYLDNVNMVRASSIWPVYVLPLSLFTAFVGLVAVGLAHHWRAGVDSAEYTQQLLKTARDQLDVSRQVLMKRGGTPKSFADVTDLQKDVAKSEALNDENDERPQQAHSESSVVYRGHEIQMLGEKYLSAGVTFKTLKGAKKYLDGLKTGPLQSPEDLPDKIGK